MGISKTVDGNEMLFGVCEEPQGTILRGLGAYIYNQNDEDSSSALFLGASSGGPISEKGDQKGNLWPILYHRTRK